MGFKIDFSGRGHRYIREEVDTVIEAMQNADPLTQGGYIKRFQKAFSEYTGEQFCFAVCNATAALEMVAQLCLFKQGDEVIIPSHTFTSSAYPFAKKGAKIIWADIDPQTRVVTAETIGKKLTQKTKAIVVVHLYGYAADMPEIMEVARKHNLIVVEDAAQALGTQINGKKAGTFGDFGVFSFHSHKNISTLGEGGMLTAKSGELADVIPLLRHNGHCNFPYERQEYWLPAMGNVDLPEVNGEYLYPNNYCIGEVECALGIELLNRIEKINEEKRKRALWFIDEFKSYEELEFHRVDNMRHNYHLLVAMVANGRRDDLIRKMSLEKGIKCVVQYYPLNRYLFYQKLGFGVADCPNADHFFDNMVSFPFQHTLSNEELEYMLVSTKEVLDDLRR